MGGHLSAGDEPISFEQGITPLFREHDRQSMKRAFDPWSHDDVVRSSDAILGRLRDGTMPATVPGQTSRSLSCNAGSTQGYAPESGPSTSCVVPAPSTRT
jgi:hypothetical protein